MFCQSCGEVYSFLPILEWFANIAFLSQSPEQKMNYQCYCKDLLLYKHTGCMFYKKCINKLYKRVHILSLEFLTLALDSTYICNSMLPCLIPNKIEKMFFIMRQTCQTTIFSLTIFRRLPTPGSGLLFVLLLFGWSNLSLLSLDLLWNPGNAVAPERLLWCGVSVCACVCVPTNKHESVAFNIRLIWSLVSQRFLHDTPQWSLSLSHTYTHTLHQKPPQL